METSPLPVKGCTFLPMLGTHGHRALRVTCLPHILRHGPTLYNGHLRGPVTLTPVAERLALKLSLPVLTTQVCCDHRSNPDHPHERRTLYVNATAAVDFIFFPWALNMIQFMNVSKFFRDYTHLKNPAKTRGLYGILRCSSLVPPTT